jgi:pyruvate dehydrogenase (quinone)
MPVLAIVGQKPRDALGGHYQREVDLVSLFKDVAGAFVQQASSPAQVRHLIDRAIRIALGDRRVTVIVLPNDLQEAPYRDPPRKHGTLRSGIGFAKQRVTLFEAELRRAAEVLNAGDKVAILVGAGALGVTGEVIGVAEKLGAGVAKALLGKAALPDDLPYVTGPIRMRYPSHGRIGVSHGRIGVSLRGVHARRGPGARGPDRHRTGHGRCAILWRSISWETLRLLLPRPGR